MSAFTSLLVFHSCQEMFASNWPLETSRRLRLTEGLAEDA